MRKVLVAIDGSSSALRGVEYVGAQFSGLDDLHVTLFHVLPYVPAEFWEDGHILGKEEQEERERVIDTWLSNQALKLEPIFRTAIKALAARGISQQSITVKSVSDSVDTAGSILEEARTGGYMTVVMGRFGRSQTGRAATGSTTHKVLHGGTGTAVCVVE
ncbi:MAG TPA: universal stress protein [Dissulfurispiraceae bacterium]